MSLTIWHRSLAKGIIVITSLVLALLIGVVAGLRTFTAPTAVSWAARSGSLALGDGPLGFFGHPVAPWIFTVLALAELVGDQLPSTPSRTVPMQFGARLVSGALSGAAIGAGASAMLPGLLAGVIGAVIGTLGGRACRGWLAGALGSDHPAAFIEDAIAIGAAVLIVVALP
ncbi:MAG TPA: hypothetical protein VFV95_21995 [Vicinamibacterales bacterium]|nr:hypothetical protein [Vicinamibacterales bacterium]